MTHFCDYFKWIIQQWFRRQIVNGDASYVKCIIFYQMNTNGNEQSNEVEIDVEAQNKKQKKDVLEKIVSNPSDIYY